MQNFIAGFDPTGVSTIAGEDLKAMIELCTTYIDKGLTITSADTAGVPAVPDASVNLDLQRYLWIRLLSTSVIVYVWSPTTANDTFGAGLKKWAPVTNTVLADGSVTNSKLADAAVTDSKVNDVSYSKITGIPAPIGNVSLSYRNVLTVGSIDGATAANQIPFDNTIPQNTEGVQIIGAPVTILSTTNFVRVKYSAWVFIPTACHVSMALFLDSGVNALEATAIYNVTTTSMIAQISLEYASVTPGAGAHTYSIRLGPGESKLIYFNQDVGGAIFGGAARTTLSVEQYITGASV